MKTNPSARSVRNFRVTLVCLALAAIVGVEFRVGESLASRFGQATAMRSDSPQAPSMDISDLMASIR
jgi:hypothetical protein